MFLSLKLYSKLTNELFGQTHRVILLFTLNQTAEEIIMQSLKLKDQF